MARLESGNNQRVGSFAWPGPHNKRRILTATTAKYNVAVCHYWAIKVLIEYCFDYLKGNNFYQMTDKKSLASQFDSYDYNAFQGFLTPFEFYLKGFLIEDFPD